MVFPHNDNIYPTINEIHTYMYNYILNSICPKSSMFVFFMAGSRKTTAFTYRGQRALGFRPKDFFKPK